mmetsp:Transcript_10803/g.12771  ORF Transcript_10803/g.12771 Transcript_10803/m.12771 type:complete len:108 (-) Transcript_10803:249-572(-)
MALFLLNQFYWENEEAKIPSLIIDLSLIITLHFVASNFLKNKKLTEMETAKKINDMNQLKKEDNRATKSSNRNYQKQNNKLNNDYKTHEKRSHHVPNHNIHQPAKFM